MCTLQQLPKGLEKIVRSLDTRGRRIEEGLFIAEGVHLCEELLKCGVEVEFVVVRTQVEISIQELCDKFLKRGVSVFEASARSFQSMSDTKSPQSCLAVVRLPKTTAELSKRVVVLQGVSDPGNVGSIIRTADWFGIQQVVIDRETADPFSHKSVRASMGSIFRVRCHMELDLVAFLDQSNETHTSIGAIVHGGTDLSALTISEKWTLWLGSESHGLSSPILDLVKNQVSIRGSGRAESLNVSVSSGILLEKLSGIGTK